MGVLDTYSRFELGDYWVNVYYQNGKRKVGLTVDVKYSGADAVPDGLVELLIESKNGYTYITYNRTEYEPIMSYIKGNIVYDDIGKYVEFFAQWLDAKGSDYKERKLYDTSESKKEEFEQKRGHTNDHHDNPKC